MTPDVKKSVFKAPNCQNRCGGWLKESYFFFLTKGVGVLVGNIGGNVVF